MVLLPDSDAMHGVRVSDHSPQYVLTCDLRDFLDLLGEEALSSEWSVSEDVWASGDRSEELPLIGKQRSRIKGDRLRELASAVTQVIDGEFTGYRAGVSEPWVVIRAVDSSYYEFYCREPAMLEKARSRFSEVSDC